MGGSADAQLQALRGGRAPHPNPSPQGEGLTRFNHQMNAFKLPD